MLAQVDPVAVSAAGAIAEKFGFPALLVVLLLAGIYLMFKANAKERDVRDERDERREQARMVERKEDREAHLGALGKHTEAVTILGTGFVRLEQKVDTIGREVEVIGRDVDGLKTKVG